MGISMYSEDNRCTLNTAHFTFSAIRWYVYDQVNTNKTLMNNGIKLFVEQNDVDGKISENDLS